MKAILGTVLLQAAGPTAPSPFGFLMPMVLIFVIFYFLMIRPQQRRQREHEQTLAAIGKGDRVVTAGGLHGTVVGTTPEVLTLALGEGGVRVKVDRARIDRVLEKGKGGDSE